MTLKIRSRIETNSAGVESVFLTVDSLSACYHSTAVLEVIPVTAFLVPSGLHCAVFVKEVSCGINFIPACYKFSVFISVIPLTVDLVPSGLISQRRDNFRLNKDLAANFTMNAVCKTGFTSEGHFRKERICNKSVYRYCTGTGP